MSASKTPREVKAIIRDYGRGVAVKVICARHRVADRTLYKILEANGVERRRSRPYRKAERVNCAVCGIKCRSRFGICRACDNPADNTIALTGGRWVIDIRRRVQVWESYFGEKEAS